MFLAYFGIIEGIAILFQYPKWIELGIQDQLLGLKKIKTVSNIPDSFWGQKWPIFAPKTAFLANFGIIEGISILFKKSKMDETQHTTSTIKADEDKSNLAHFQHILGPKIAHFCPQKLHFWLILR